MQVLLRYGRPKQRIDGRTDIEPLAASVYAAIHQKNTSTASTGADGVVSPDNARGGWPELERVGPISLAAILANCWYAHRERVFENSF